ncbi:uncharacterized protein DS421_3g77170 [Arachis hypogaea]|nr:uncharacterized protein DS421_3g77170 [Arachis hypogaea]
MLFFSLPLPPNPFGLNKISVAGEARTPDETGKGYNLRVDPSHRSANRFTPSVFKRAVKKCKNFVKDVNWTMRK